MDFTKLKDFLDFYLPMLGVPGSDTVIYKDHQEIFRHTSGFDSIKNRTPMRRDSLYNIFSCTKISTCVAIMQLVERGQILLTDPVHVYLPEYKNLNVAVYESDGSVTIKKNTKTMLIKHLLSMTSGLDYNLNRPAIKALKESNSEGLSTRDFVRAIAEDPLGFEPGTHYCYGLSHDVLGAIIEVVSGLSLEEYMQKNIFVPLGMKDTTFKVSNLNYGRIASQYEYDSVGRCSTEIQRDTNAFRFSTN